MQPGPQKKGEKEKNSANSVTPGPQVSERSLAAGPGVHTRSSSAITPGKVSERSIAAPGVRLSTEVEERSFEIAEGDSQWRPVPKKKAATKKFLASYNNHDCSDGCCDGDDGYLSDSTRRVPSWP